MIRRIRRLAPVLLLAVALPLSGQSFQDEFATDLTAQKEKFVALFDAIPDEVMSWRPAEGVRSTSEVFMHVSLGNLMLPNNLMGAPMPQGMRPEWGEQGEQVMDRASIRQAIVMGLDHLIALAGSTPDTDLTKAASIFGRPSNVRGAMMLLHTHNHEHLGQLIAYARMNGVTPPWSR